MCLLRHHGVFLAVLGNGLFLGCVVKVHHFRGCGVVILQELDNTGLRVLKGAVVEPG